MEQHHGYNVFANIVEKAEMEFKFTLEDPFKVFLKIFLMWVESQRLVEGAILVSSHARGGARQDSDIDLVLLCTEYESYLEDVSWINDFGKPVSVRLEDYGKLTSVRVFYEEGPGVEFGFTQLDWLVLPLDVGTVGVLRNGFRIVYDRSGKYSALELQP